MYRAGIDLGGTNIKAGIVDEQQHIIAEASVPTNVERPYQDIIRDMAELVKTLLKQYMELCCIPIISGGKMFRSQSS